MNIHSLKRIGEHLVFNKSLYYDYFSKIPQYKKETIPAFIYVLSQVYFSSKY